MNYRRLEVALLLVKLIALIALAVVVTMNHIHVQRMEKELVNRTTIVKPE